MHMRVYWSPGYIIFTIFNYLIIAILALSCVLPIVNLLAISLSSARAVGSGQVGFWPVEFQLISFELILENTAFWRAGWISIQRVAAAVPLVIAMTIISAYPLSREPEEFKMRTFFMFFFIVTMVFGGGLIPSFMIINAIGLMDNFWVFIIPGMFSAWNAILMMHFIRGLPRELEEAAEIDGATKLKVLYKVLIPLLKPSIATIALFTAVGHWNDWFTGFIFFNRPESWPLQTYLRSIVVNPALILRTLPPDQVARMMTVSDRTSQAAQLFVALIPLMIAYPFAQKYFAGGMTLGSVKG